ncbi:MAG: hypothetical protein GC204_13705 [Chloroflexi bacterium]|nr:hypothetical protein [Chloroflexota bacterium]
MGTYTDLLKLSPKKPIPLSPMGDVGLDHPAPSDSEPTVASEVIPLPQTKVPHAQKPEYQNARKLENKKDRNLASQNARKPENQKTDLNEFLTSMLTVKTLAKTSYRYPQELLNKLADAEYELRRSKDKKIHMNTIVVFALAYLLWDYAERGEQSLLVTLT